MAAGVYIIKKKKEGREMRTVALISIAATFLCGSSIADEDVRSAYCRDVIEPVLNGILTAKWTAKGADEGVMYQLFRENGWKVDWKVVRRSHSIMSDVWIGFSRKSGDFKWRLGIGKSKDGSFIVDGRMWPFSDIGFFVTNMVPSDVKIRVFGIPQSVDAAEKPIGDSSILVAEAYSLRKERRFPEASKKLRQAQALDPLNAWADMERMFLNDESENAMAAARNGRAYPMTSVMTCRSAYLGIGATNEVEFIDGRLMKRRMK